MAYAAMCYYKLDYYDVSLEILAVYLQAHPDRFAYSPHPLSTLAHLLSRIFKPFLTDRFG